jgi:hypothetical protein
MSAKIWRDQAKVLTVDDGKGNIRLSEIILQSGWFPTGLQYL